MISARFDDLGADGALRRLGIMGGTFDPVHLGHLACAERARAACKLDAVLFVPAGAPAFKLDRAVTPARERLRMCELACAGNPHFDVSDMEIARGGVTYTVDTARVLRAHYPANVELYFILGADALLTLPRWRASAELAGLVRFAAVTRPGFEVPAAVKEELRAHDAYAVDYVEAPTLEVSSSDVRARAPRGESLHSLVPDAVRAYIERHGLYRRAGARDADEGKGRDHGVR